MVRITDHLDPEEVQRIKDFAITTIFANHTVIDRGLDLLEQGKPIDKVIAELEISYHPILK